ncbi:MAG TPA: hypothetical protein VH062_00760 [Polyangiaceae bacterium]|jgi:hypothetical protein|nr:hypothetical protein [Polyangiaceae bacterium]
MPKQEGTTPFQETEALYRRLIEDWVGEDGAVDPAAIEVPQCSVDRALLATPEQALARCNDAEVAIATTTFGALPDRFVAEPIPTQPVQPKPYELIVVFVPEKQNAAHSHIEVRQEGSAEPRKPKSVMKQRIRDEVAATMRVTHRKPP